MSDTAYFGRKLTRKQRIRIYLSWPYLRQVGPLYRLTCWWLNRGGR